MNILILTCVAGFLPKFLMQDVQLLMDGGHEVHYATNFENPVYECNRTKLEAAGIRCHPIPIAKSPARVIKNAKAFLALKRLVHRERIDALYLHNPMGGVLGRLLTFSKKRLFVIYTAHGFHFYKGAPKINWLLYYPVEKLLARRTDVLITINEEDKRMAESFRLKKGGIVLRIPGIGLDSERFAPNWKDRDALREKLSVGPDTFLFLSVGELNENKNHAAVIRAFAQMADENTRLFICGKGPKREDLEGLIQELHVEDGVTLCGYQTTIEKYYQAADCFLFPSYREGLGMASIEAMACGLPLIVADNRGTREYAFSENSFVCQPQDAAGFAEAMRKMKEDNVLRFSMAKSSIQLSKRFEKARTAEVMAQVFEKMKGSV